MIVFSIVDNDSVVGLVVENRSVLILFIDEMMNLNLIKIVSDS